MFQGAALVDAHKSQKCDIALICFYEALQKWTLLLQGKQVITRHWNSCCTSHSPARLRCPITWQYLIKCPFLLNISRNAIGMLFIMTSAKWTGPGLDATVLMTFSGPFLFSGRNDIFNIPIVLFCFTWFMCQRWAAHPPSAHRASVLLMLRTTLAFILWFSSRNVLPSKKYFSLLF